MIPPMSWRRTLPLGLAMLVSFSLAFVVLWRSRGFDPPVAAPGGPTNAGDRRSGPAQQNARRADLRAIAGPASAEPAMGSAAPGASTSLQASAAPELPVELHFRNRSDLHKIQTSVSNNSDGALAVDAIVFDPRTKQRSKVQIYIGAYKATAFGVDDGLDIQPGDEITLQCAPYQDRVFVIR